MIGPFAVINEDFQLYLINFHIAHEAFRRGELPSKEVMDFLYEFKSQGLLDTVYQEETEHSQKNLEKLIQIAVNGSGIATIKHEKTIDAGEGPVRIDSYETDPKSSVLYVLRRVKTMDSYWIKSMLNVRAQSASGFFDHKGFRIIVESQEARQFRKHRSYQALSHEEKETFRKTFGRKKFNQLSDDEKSRFYAIFSVDYENLTPQEKQEYKRRFRDSPRKDSHGKICRNLAERIATLESLDTIPLNPHYMDLKGLELRVQRQVIVDYAGKKILEFEYILKRHSGKGNSLFEKIFESASSEVIDKTGDITEYLDINGTSSYLVNFGDLLANFHVYDSSAKLDVETLAAKIQISYQKALQKFKGKNPDENQSKILKSIRLGMEDIPIGFFIYSETTTKDLRERYSGMGLDRAMVFDMFIKDRTGEKAEANGYEDVKLYLCFNPDSKELSGECQIRDTISDQIALHDRYHEGRKWVEKAARSPKEYQQIDEEDKKFGSAFFNTDNVGMENFFNIFAHFYAGLVKQTIQSISEIDTIPREQEKFDSLFDQVKSIFKEARQRLNESGLESLVEAISSTIDVYATRKGMGVITYVDSIWSINNAIITASRELKRDFKYFDEIPHLSEYLHKKHIELLYHAFERLAMSEDANDVAASIFVGQLIKNYNKHYGNHLPSETQKEYRERVDNFAKANGWKHYKIGRINFEYIPYRLLKGGKIQKAIRDRNLLISSDGPLRDFDVQTAGNVINIYNRITKNI